MNILNMSFYFQVRLNAYGATEAGPISVGFFGGENMGILACRVKVKVVFNRRVGMNCNLIHASYLSMIIVTGSYFSQTF